MLASASPPSAVSGGARSSLSARIARQRVQVFKPATDVRHEPDRLVTRDLRELAAVSVSDAAELRSRLQFGVQVVGVDEAQFFDESLADLATELADAGIRVVVAGLDQDYSRRPFGPMPRLLALRDVSRSGPGPRRTSTRDTSGPRANRAPRHRARSLRLSPRWPLAPLIG